MCPKAYAVDRAHGQLRLQGMIVAIRSSCVMRIPGKLRVGDQIILREVRRGMAASVFGNLGAACSRLLYDRERIGYSVAAVSQNALARRRVIHGGEIARLRYWGRGQRLANHWERTSELSLLKLLATAIKVTIGKVGLKRGAATQMLGTALKDVAHYRSHSTKSRYGVVGIKTQPSVDFIPTEQDLRSRRTD